MLWELFTYCNVHGAKAIDPFNKTEYRVLFYGPNSEARAKEYINWKNKEKG